MAPVQRPHWKRLVIYFVLFVAAVGLLAVVFRRVLSDNTIGADFFIYWRAGRAVLSEHSSPYDPAVTRAIQMGIYGRVAEPDEDQVAFAYPAYTLFWIFPFAWLSFENAQAVWMALFFVGWLAAGLWLAKPAPWLGATLVFFYPLSFGLLLGNFNVLVGLALFILMGLLRAGRDSTPAAQAAAGLCLTLALAKPQFAWLVLLFAVLLLVRWRRWIALGSFLAASAFMAGSSLLAFPGWIDAWLRQSRAYNVYIPPEPLLIAFPGQLFDPPVSRILAYLLIAAIAALTALLYLRWLRRPAPQTFTGEEIRLLGLSAWATYMLHPWPKSYEQIVLLIPLLLWSTALIPRRPWLVGLVLLAGLVLSWVALIDNLHQLTPTGIYAWPALYFTAWLILVWRLKTPERYPAHGHP